MTKKQIRLHKLGNAQRRVKGGEWTAPDNSKAAKAHLLRRYNICKAKGDLQPKG